MGWLADASRWSRDWPTDPDGLTLEDELLFGTDPEDADTDGGGARDGSEVMSGTDPANPNDDLNYFDVGTLSMSAQFGIDAASRPAAVDLAGVLMEPSMYGFAYAVDPATGEVFLDINDELVFIDSANIDLGAGMITQGWYNISSLYFYTFY